MARGVTGKRSMRSGAETRRVARANPRLMDPGTHWPGPGQALLQAGNSARYWGHVLSAWQQARLQQRSYGSSASSGTTSSNVIPHQTAKFASTTVTNPEVSNYCWLDLDRMLRSFGLKPDPCSRSCVGLTICCRVSLWLAAYERL